MSDTSRFFSVYEQICLIIKIPACKMLRDSYLILWHMFSMRLCSKHAFVNGIIRFGIPKHVGLCSKGYYLLRDTAYCCELSSL